MKKLMIIFLLVILSAGLFGCSDNVTDTQAKAPSDSPSEPAKQEDVNSDSVEATTAPEKKEPEKSQKMIDLESEFPDFQNVKLLKESEVNKTVDLNPLMYTIKKAEVVELQNPTQSMAEWYKQYANYQEGTPMHMFTIRFELENKSDKNFMINYPIYTIILSTGEQIDVSMADLINHSGSGEFYSKSKKNDLAVSVPFTSKPDEIKSFRIVTDNLYDKDYSTIKEPVEANFDLK
ncbi:hypothetical protein Q7A53_05545 [Halobacillus rhizosphaerae]|uniref:hypothetical protein n=1 Tax=Halobacillus rhizosphaerae TaxID=3064889 RepID=UPI00398B6CD5